MFKSISKVGILAVLATFVFSGCSAIKQIGNFQNDFTSSEDKEVTEARNKVQTTKDHLEIAADRQANVTTQNTLEATINSLATQMMQNKKMNTFKPVLITSFVRLDQFKKTTEFGRIVSESLLNEMSTRGFNIIEYRGQMAVSVNDQGEYFITRKPHQLKNKVPNTYVVVGTYSRQYKKIMLNARVIDNVTGKIISSARATYNHGRMNDCILFNDCRPARTINIVKE